MSALYSGAHYSGGTSAAERATDIAVEHYRDERDDKGTCTDVCDCSLCQSLDAEEVLYHAINDFRRSYPGTLVDIATDTLTVERHDRYTDQWIEITRCDAEDEGEAATWERFAAFLNTWDGGSGRAAA